MKNDAVAVGSTLLRIGIQVPGTCKRCGEQETTMHILTQCAFADKVRELVPSLFTPAVISTTDLFRLRRRLVNLPPSGLTALLCPWILWLFWTNMNKFQFEDKSFSETELVTRALVLAREWQTTALPIGPRFD